MIRFLPRPVISLTMPTTTRADLIAKMEELGEVAPAHWTAPQIKARISELKDERKQAPTLKNKIAALNKLAKKKATLFEHALQLGLPVTNNMTVAQMYAQVEAHITMEVPAVAHDKMSFGQYRDATYKEVLNKYPSYAQWAVTTYQEDANTCWRLKRFAEWVMQYQTMEPPPVPVTPRTSAKTVAKTKGYPVAGMSSHSPPGDSSDASFSVVEDTMSAELAKLRAELEIAKKDKAELELTLGRSKSRKEM